MIRARHGDAVLAHSCVNLNGYFYRNGNRLRMVPLLGKIELRQTIKAFITAYAKQVKSFK